MPTVEKIGILLSISDANQEDEYLTTGYLSEIVEKRLELENFDDYYEQFYFPGKFKYNFEGRNRLFYNRLKGLGIEYISTIETCNSLLPDFGIFLTEGKIVRDDICDNLPNWKVEKVTDSRELYKWVKEIKGGISPLNVDYYQQTFLVLKTPEGSKITTLSTFNFNKASHLRDFVLSSEIEERKK